MVASLFASKCQGVYVLYCTVLYFVTWI